MQKPFYIYRLASWPCFSFREFKRGMTIPLRIGRCHEEDVSIEHRPVLEWQGLRRKVERWWSEIAWVIILFRSKGRSLHRWHFAFSLDHGSLATKPGGEAPTDDRKPCPPKGYDFEICGSWLSSWRFIILYCINHDNCKSSRWRALFRVFHRWRSGFNVQTF